MTVPDLRSDPAADRERLQRALGLLLLDQAELRAWERLLFVECGDGWIVEEAWRRVRRGHACGVDRSAALIARANALRAVPGALEFDTWDGARLPYVGAFFHHVLSTAAIDRGSDPTVALREMRRVLQPGGTVDLLCLPELATGLVESLGSAGFEESVKIGRCGVDVEAALVRARAPLFARHAPTLDRCTVA